MNEKERQIAVSLLKAARICIEQGEVTHICYALQVACRGRSDIAYRVKLQLHVWIRVMLKGRGSLEAFLQYSIGCKKAKQIDTKLTRIKWIEWMIQEMERP